MRGAFKRNLHVKKRSAISEREGAKELGGRPTIASGALSIMKGDISMKHTDNPDVPVFLCEDKFTDKESYSLTRKTWDKIEAEARRAAKRPLMRITIAGKVMYVLDQRTFLQLKNANES